MNLSNRLRRSLVASVAVAAVTLSAALTMAAPAQAAKPDRTSKAAIASIRDQINKLTAEGKTPDQIAKQAGLKVVSQAEEESVGTMSLGSDYNVPTPTIYFDENSYLWWVTAKFNWNNSNYRNDCGGYYSYNCGGADGFGIRSSVLVENMGNSYYFCPSGWFGASPRPGTPQCTYSGWEFDSSEAGVTIGFQDKVVTGGYCGGTDYLSCAYNQGVSGSVTFTFRPLVGGCHQFFSRYEHTWSSTAVTGMGVSTSGFNMSWSNTSNHQQRTSAVPGKMGC